MRCVSLRKWCHLAAVSLLSSVAMVSVDTVITFLMSPGTGNKLVSVLRRNFLSATWSIRPYDSVTWKNNFESGRADIPALFVAERH